MSIWSDHGVEDAVHAILAAVPAPKDPHRLGRGYVTSYQLAVALRRDHPDVFEAIPHDIGGVGTGRHVSVAQYLGRELSRRYRDGSLRSDIEGAFLSDQDVTSMVFGGDVVSSVAGTGYDLSLWRLATPAPSSSP